MLYLRNTFKKRKTSGLREKEFQDKELWSIPMSSVSKYSPPSESTQASTLTKSATNEGMLHFRTAVFPRMTYSDTTSAS